jgi:hypothetical protein
LLVAFQRQGDAPGRIHLGIRQSKDLAKGGEDGGAIQVVDGAQYPLHLQEHGMGDEDGL